MKKNITLIILLTVFLTPISYSQFFGEDGKEITECDCNKRLDELDVTVDLPNSINEYDIIIFTIIDDQKNGLSYRKFRTSSLRNKSEISFNLLNPKQKGKQVILIPGQEGKLFQGKDFTTSYNSLCERSSDERKIFIKMIGVKQVGTEIEYSYDESRDVIKGKTRELYDNGTLIQTSEPLKIIPRKELKSSKLHTAFAYVGGVISAAVAGVVYFVMNKPFEEAQ